mmetsp:Transcript_77549/g.216739  ORF Transcript_77549/g.216739 Transcript_77549/m.216739 type:complete len:206 (+) Transcript_77549:133-750(+)
MERLSRSLRRSWVARTPPRTSSVPWRPLSGKRAAPAAQATQDPRRCRRKRSRGRTGRAGGAARLARPRHPRAPRGAPKARSPPAQSCASSPRRGTACHPGPPGRRGPPAPCRRGRAGSSCPPGAGTRTLAGTHGASTARTGARRRAPAHRGRRRCAAAGAATTAWSPSRVTWPTAAPTPPRQSPREIPPGVRAHARRGHGGPRTR